MALPSEIFPPPPSYWSLYRNGNDSVVINLSTTNPSQVESDESGLSIPLRNLTQILGHHQKLIFVPTKTSHGSYSTKVVQLRDVNDTPILSTLHSPTVKISTEDGGNRLVSRAVTKVTDPSGLLLLVTSEKECNSMEVTSGGLIVGLVERQSGHLIAKNPLGITVLKTARLGGDFKFLLENGTHIATLGKNKEQKIAMTIQEHLDSGSTGLLVSMAFHIYHRNFGIGRMERLACGFYLGIFLLVLFAIAFGAALLNLLYQ